MVTVQIPTIIDYHSLNIKDTSECMVDRLVVDYMYLAIDTLVKVCIPEQIVSGSIIAGVCNDEQTLIVNDIINFQLSNFDAHRSGLPRPLHQRQIM